MSTTPPPHHPTSSSPSPLPAPLPDSFPGSEAGSVPGLRRTPARLAVVAATVASLLYAVLAGLGVVVIVADLAERGEFLDGLGAVLGAIVFVVAAIPALGTGVAAGLFAAGVGCRDEHKARSRVVAAQILAYVTAGLVVSGVAGIVLLAVGASAGDLGAASGWILVVAGFAAPAVGVAVVARSALR